MDGRRLRVGSPKEIVFFLATPLNMPWAFYQFWLALNHACTQSVTGVISHWYSHKCNHWVLYSRTAWYPSSNLTAVPMNTGFSTGITFWGKVYADIHLPYQTTPKTLIRPNSTWFWTPTKCFHRHVFFLADDAKHLFKEKVKSAKALFPLLYYWLTSYQQHETCMEVCLHLCMHVPSCINVSLCIHVYICACMYMELYN